MKWKDKIIISTFSDFFPPQEHDINFDEHGMMVLGCGPYHIGNMMTSIYIGPTIHICINVDSFLFSERCEKMLSQ